MRQSTGSFARWVRQQSKFFGQCFYHHKSAYRLFSPFSNAYHCCCYCSSSLEFFSVLILFRRMPVMDRLIRDPPSIIYHEEESSKAPTPNHPLLIAAFTFSMQTLSPCLPVHFCIPPLFTCRRQFGQ